MPDTLYYDGLCPVCAHEIKLLQKLKRDSLTLIDIHSLNSKATDDDICRNALLAILHLKTSEGRWLKGLDATVQAWRHTPVGWLLAPLRWPLIKQVADKAYTFWAYKRICKLGYSEG